MPTMTDTLSSTPFKLVRGKWRATREGVRYVLETPAGAAPTDADAPVVVRVAGTSRFCWYDTARAAALKWAA